MIFYSMVALFGILSLRAGASGCERPKLVVAQVGGGDDGGGNDGSSGERGGTKDDRGHALLRYVACAVGFSG